MSDGDDWRQDILANADFAVREYGALTDFAFGYDLASVEWLDGYIERVRRRLKDGPSDGTISVIGSYLGEAIIAATGASWVDDPDHGIGVVFDNGDACYPFAKVRKQFAGGHEDGESIASFYNIALNFVAQGKLGQT